MVKTIDLKPVRMMTSLSILVMLATALFPLPLSAQSRDAARDLQNAFREVSSEVLPVVVEVNTVNIVERRTVNPFEFFFRSPNSPGGNEPFQNEQFRQQGLGSGVIVERRGNTIYVLTNNHVVENAEEIEVNLNDGRTFDAEMIGGDPLRDLALVAFDTREDVPVARLGDSDEVWVGDWVLAVGNPLGFESTVTAGIISAKGRRAQGQSFTDYLQTDASINRGNSGGALVNLDGEVIGINTFIASNSGGSIGLGFAIPINNARRAIDDFISKGSVEYAWLGVNMGDLNDTIAEELQIKDRSGAFIYNIYGESPAMEGGILPGDLIISMAGRTVEDSDDLSRTVASLSPGEEVPVGLIRNGNTVSISIPLAVRTIEKDGMKVNVWPGFSVVPVTSDIRDQMRIPRNAGNVLIGGVVNDSAASALGLRSGDVIKSINRRNVRDLKDFYDRINTDDRLEIKVVRQGHELEFILNK
ncbi:MAG: Do family serine endopeptidase [Spirochaetaceae bacterium]|nr:Do family serine endopeptidase [Spirochaetaceae bacterium]